MPKRIEFIAPVEAMRGNLSGRQVLEYQLNNNPAFEAPAGSTSYARNYTTRFIGAKRISDGLKYFSVKTKTATTLTPAALQAMALLGGAGAIYAAIVRNKTSELYNQLYAQYIDTQAAGGGFKETFREVVMRLTRSALQNKEVQIHYIGVRGDVAFNNPWVVKTQTTGAEISQTVFVKFWEQLAQEGFYYYVNKDKGISADGLTFDNITGNTLLNILNLSLEERAGVNYVKQGDTYLKYDDEYVKGTDEMVVDGRYTTTTVAPN